MKKEEIYYDNSVEDVIEKVNNLLKSKKLEIVFDFGEGDEDEIKIYLQTVKPKEGE